jgi:hypothetical protein
VVKKALQFALRGQLSIGHQVQLDVSVLHDGRFQSQRVVSGRHGLSNFPERISAALLLFWLNSEQVIHKALSGAAPLLDLT